MKRNKNIGIVTSSRADFYLLEKIIFNLKRKSNLKLLITGTHHSKKYGYSYRYISKIKNCKKINIKIDTHQTTKKKIILNAGKIFKNCSKIFDKEKLDILIVLGDRFELLPFASSAVIFNVPIVHIHGGEITHGSTDDQVRHSISKLSNYHFTSNNEYKKRLIQMGEKKENIFNYGSLGVENALKTKFLSRKVLEEKFKIKFIKKNVLVNYHPETAVKKDISKDFEKVMYSCKRFKNVNFIFTYPNFDNKSNSIIKILTKYNRLYKNFFVIKNFGQRAFFSIVRNVDFVMGNSSSGIIEVPALKKPTINIGIRQSGRVKTKSIFDCKTEKKSIISMMKFLFVKKHVSKIKYNTFHNPNTSKKICSKILGLNINKTFPKKFIDVNKDL